MCSPRWRWGCEERDCLAEYPELDEAAITFLDAASRESLTNPERRSHALVMYGREDEPSKQSAIAIARDRADTVEVGLSFGGLRGPEILASSQEQIEIFGSLESLEPPNLTYEEIETLVAAANVENGARLFDNIENTETRTCSGCHAADSEEATARSGASGPGLLNIGERAASRVEGQSAAVYLYYSIVAPAQYNVEGYESGMWSDYDDALTQAEIADLVAYLLTLK